MQATTAGAFFLLLCTSQRRTVWHPCFLKFPAATMGTHCAGNGLIQLLDYARDEFEWRHQGGAGGILSLALQPEPR